LAGTEPLLEPKPNPKKDKATTVLPAKKGILVKTMAFKSIVHFFSSMLCFSSSSSGRGEGAAAGGGGEGGAGGEGEAVLPEVEPNPNPQ
jgi:hypothetical protein